MILKKDFPFVIGDVLICIKKYQKFHIKFEIGDRCKLGAFSKSGFNDEFISAVHISKQQQTHKDMIRQQSNGVLITFSLDPTSLYLFDYFISESEYRKMKIISILSE